MAKPITFTIRGADRFGDDAPTVEDLLGQIETWIGVLRGVEAALAEDEKPELVWRVTDARKNSPLTFEITPFTSTFGLDIERRAKDVVTATAKGVKALVETGERPMYFTDKILDHIEKAFARVSNGLTETTVDFSKYEVPNIEAKSENAALSICRIKDARPVAPTPHRELGSLEGFIHRVELDGYGRPVVWLRARLDGQEVKCISDQRGLDRIGHLELSKVLKGLRVRVFGTLNYKDLDRLSSINVDDVHVFDLDKDLPSRKDIIDPEFTAGVESSKYLEALRGDA